MSLDLNQVHPSTNEVLLLCYMCIHTLMQYNYAVYKSYSEMGAFGKKNH